MNQTRILLGVILLLAGAFGYLQWSQRSDLAKEREDREEQKRLIEALLAAKDGGAKPAGNARTELAGAPAVPTSAGASPTTGSGPAPSVGPEGTSPSGAEVATSPVPSNEFLTADQKWRALKDQELAKMREENEALRLQGQAAIEERDRLSAELEVAKFQIDRRMAQIREAPMVGRVTRVVPEHGFLIISAGRGVGIEPKDEFSIRRDGKIICHIRVSDSVDEAESVADPIRGSMAPKETVREGDEVIKMD